ncbi:NADH:flavin oxidoreductase [Novosphingobium taihuense]|uniref:2,4-dienoyl-CoA reductase-like NADH-dependent reductase (Old Yellow Enzyme family) n=1 Tax=Novosphingobium taihuense TaxID=260085 RepID=A0A7W7EVV2_9SPHN|nr:NADH:flavin oxidoreductase [Novosphingobium taihuense]MBB4615439.1 2,4-dienoyl-CoA reductase-like NADH-dependent reductase (Old Yellow Enzyme family) [Novosphingobium taihuense]TWH82113.1 2,4-dienoyl-CoA reductase-like NADH-dependent reductase (Old Yellow Enzyme family) [Novosphingobium taihuense]
MSLEFQAEIAPLFEPFALRSLSLANRVVMAPMTRGFSPSGVPGKDVAGYYARRADCGLIITEGVGVDHPAALGGSGVDGDNAPHMYGRCALEGWRAVVDTVHAAGGKIMPQLWHQGVMREMGTGPHPEVETVRPSGVWGPLDRTAMVTPEYLSNVAAKPGRAMTDEEVVDVIEGFARSARYAMDVGFDGIAIHGAHGYMVDDFLWDGTNSRTDRWGGDHIGRAAFAVELVKAIRREIGLEPVINFRFSQWKQQDVRARLAETPGQLGEILGPIADAGVDIFDGSQRYFDKAEFEGSSLNLAGWAKKLTGKAAQTVGGVGLSSGVYDSKRTGGSDAARENIANVAQRLARGEFDLVGVGRAIMHDPAWVGRVQRGEELLPFAEASRFVLT